MNDNEKKPNSFELELEALRFQARFSILMLSVGFIVVLLGFGLLIAGVAGSVELVVEADSFSGKLTNASPGIVLTLLGILVIRWSRVLIGIHRSNSRIGKLPSAFSMSVNHGMLVSKKGGAYEPVSQLDGYPQRTIRSSRLKKTRD